MNVVPATQFDRLKTDYDRLVDACVALFAADHYDHFAARMSDSEMAAIEAIKAALPSTGLKGVK